MISIGGPRDEPRRTAFTRALGHRRAGRVGGGASGERVAVVHHRRLIIALLNIDLQEPLIAWLSAHQRTENDSPYRLQLCPL